VEGLDMLVLNAGSLKSKAAVSELSSEIAEQLPRLAARRLLPLHDITLRAPTCALVGNGGLLLMDRYVVSPPSYPSFADPRRSYF
jgi:hypothetical protein